MFWPGRRSLRPKPATNAGVIGGREFTSGALATFPRGKFDDQVDSTSQALGWIAVTPPEPALLSVYRQECERIKRKS